MFTKFLSIFQRRLIVTYCRRTNNNNNNKSDNIKILLNFHNRNDNNLINVNIRKNSSNSNNNNYKHQNNDTINRKNIRSTLYYVTAAGVLFIGCTYAAVPLYRMFCQAYSYGGTVKHGGDNVENMKKIEDRILRIKFNADVSSSMRWNFRPQQREIRVIPGETALAFYTAKNPTDQPVIGISTYNVIPFEAGQYFNKIQCFCFEEQQLNPHEEVDMPVFFYIDPEFVDDPKMEFIDEIILSYTFFESKEGMKLPIPSYITRTH